MDSLYLLIPIAMVFLIVALGLFFWSVRSGQYDDLHTEGKRILFDDVVDSIPTKSSPKPSSLDDKKSDVKKLDHET